MQGVADGVGTSATAELKPWVVWFWLALTVAVALAFLPVIQALGGPLLDTVLTGGAAHKRLAELSASQRDLHFWTTALLDSLYPFAYGNLCLTLARRGPPLWTRRLAWLTLAGVLADLSENIVQLLALVGTADYLTTKNWLTPAKFGLVTLAETLAVLGVLVQRQRGRSVRS
jgi:hypothetical protein